MGQQPLELGGVERGLLLLIQDQAGQIERLERELAAQRVVLLALHDLLYVIIKILDLDKDAHG